MSDDPDLAPEADANPPANTTDALADGPPPQSVAEEAEPGAKPPVEPIPPYPVPIDVYVGEIVTYHVGAGWGDPALTSNGATELPAIVVRKWGSDYVNLQVLRDGPGPVWISSVREGTAPGQYSRR